MNHGIQTIVYPVKDLARARDTYTRLLGVEPEVDSPYYVGFKVDGQDIGLDPNSHRSGMTAYYHVSDIQSSLQSLLDAGATLEQEIREVGGGRQIASVHDAEGNLIGLLQDS